MDALVDELLLARGVARDDLARHRDPRIRDFLPDPSCFQDMDKGAKRLADAVQRGETIAIFGDYDVDGATSAALLVLLLRRLGAEPMVYIPDRLMEGYGPSGKALVELKARGASRRDLRRLRRAGVRGARRSAGGRARRDRRRPSPMRQPASRRARADQSQPARRERGRRGARPSRRGRHGLPARRRAAPRAARTRRFFEALAEPKIIDLLDLVALGTVADVARLKGLNRAFVTQGLKVMAARQNIGLGALAEAARLVKPPSCRDLGFALGPRINAGGRVGKSDLGVRLLTCDRPRGGARHRRRARPPQRGTPRDRDAGLRAGRGAGRASSGDAPVIVGHELRLAPGRDRHRRRAPQGTVRPAGDRHRGDARTAPARARAARSPASISARRCSPRRTAAC